VHFCCFLHALAFRWYCTCAGDHRCSLAPQNVSSEWLTEGGVNISWTPQHHPHPYPHHHHHQQQQQQRQGVSAGCRFVIEYRTVGQWVPLTQTAISGTWFAWRTASRGAVYQFRVISQDFTSALRSPPSLPNYLETGGTRRTATPISSVVG